MWMRLMLIGTMGSMLILLCGGEPSGTVAQEAAAKEKADAVKAAPNKVIGVTIYSNSALVTREVEVPEGAGTTQLTVTPLPPTTVQSSLYTEGTEQVRVLSTLFRTRPIFEDTRADVRRVQDEMKQLQQSQEKAESDQKAIEATQTHLGKLENFTAVTTTSSAEKAALNSEAAIALSKYIIETRSAQFRDQVKIKQQIQEIQEKMEFARRKLADLASSPNRTEQDAIITVDRGNGGGGKVRLNYLVEGASWRPQYKLRADREAKEAVKLEYLAAVAQHTGEDWSNVRLVLSTAQPMLNAAPPDLQALNVTVKPRSTAPTPQQQAANDLEEQVRTLRSKAQKDFNEKKEASGAKFFNSAAALDQSWELLNPEAAVKRGCALAFKEGPTVTYHLSTPLTVPSRNDEQIIEVTRFEVAPDYYYKAVPVMTTHVYRMADLTNKSKYVLLPGEATMYIGTDFVGQQNMPLVAIGEQFTAGFGVDPQLQVQRQMMDRFKTMSGGNQSLKYDYRILVSSYKPERVKVQVWDRLPFADTEAVGVTLIKSQPEISKDALYQREQRPNNLMRWDVQVDASMNGEKALAIKYEFKLELDKQMTITSFQSATAALSEVAPPNSPAPPPAAAPMRMAHTMPAAPPMTSAEEAKIRQAMARLSPEDRKLAEAQVWCAVDQDSRLGSTGPVLKEVVKGRPVFICCRGCASEVRSNPDEAIRLLDKLMAKMKPQGRGR